MTPDTPVLVAVHCHPLSVQEQLYPARCVQAQTLPTGLCDSVMGSRSPGPAASRPEFKSKLSLEEHAELPQPSSSPLSPPSCSFSLAFLSWFHCPCVLCNATSSSSVLGHLFHPCFCKIFHLGVFQIPMDGPAPLPLKIPMMAVGSHCVGFQRDADC